MKAKELLNNGGDIMKHMTLYGTVARSPCAYCTKHQVSLTVKQIKKRKCLSKECWYLKKYDHEFWRQRNILKAKKKARKAERKLNYGSI